MQNTKVKRVVDPKANLSGGIFPGYVPNPYSPPRPNTPPVAPDVPLAVFRAAQEAGASHLSADGRRIYCQRFGTILEAEWDGARFGSWFPFGYELPGDAVRM